MADQSDPLPVDTTPALRVVFICSGNICRSPMAELAFRERLAEVGMARAVKVGSAGIGPWHAGEPIDPRAARTLAAAGIPTVHVATQVDECHLAADLLLAMDSGHYRELVRQIEKSGGDPSTVRMFRSFDPEADGDLDVPDPYYDGRDGFTDLLTVIERTVGGLLDWVREQR